MGASLTLAAHLACHPGAVFRQPGGRRIRDAAAVVHPLLQLHRQDRTAQLGTHVHNSVGSAARR